MAAGRMIIPGWMPAVDSDGVPIPNARMFFYENNTTTLATIYAEEALTTPLTNPVEADSSGQFPAIWADDANLFSVTVDAPYGPPGQPFTFDDLGPSTSANTSGLNKLDRDGGNAESNFLDTVGALKKDGVNIADVFATSGTSVVTSLGPNVPDPGIYMSRGGVGISFQTLVSSPTGAADDDNQRTMFLVNGESQDGGNSEEQLGCFQFAIDSGYLEEFIPNHAYALNEEFVDTPGNNIYQVTTAGTSGATAPTGKGTGIANGTMVVKWINDAAIGAKLAVYIEATAGPNAGSVWGEVANLELKSGNKSKFACARETDLTNNTGIDSEFGGLNRYGHYIGIQGPNRSTAGQQISSANTATWAAFWGSYYAGTKLAQNAVICVDASSAIGLGFGAGAGGAVTPTFTTATIRDRSISPTGLSLAGTYSSAQISLPQGGGAPAAISISGTKTLATYLDAATAPKAITLQGSNSVAAIEVSATTPAAFSSIGTKTIGGFVDSSTAPYGINLSGTYSTAAINSNGFQVLSDGSVVAVSLRFATLPGNFADDAAAATGGILVGGVYRTGSVLKVRVT